MPVKDVLARQPGIGSRCRGLHQLAHGRDERLTGLAGRTDCVDAVRVGCAYWA